jgi:hypothetical protein
MAAMTTTVLGPVLVEARARATVIGVLEAGRRYRFSIGDVQGWSDGAIPSDPVTGNARADAGRVLGFLFKKMAEAPFGALVGRIEGAPHSEFAVGDHLAGADGGADYAPTVSGELIVAFNDVILDAAYADNAGTLRLTVLDVTPA